jgi:cyclin-dependent kinase 7
LLEKTLAMDPNRRCTAKEALKMPYFNNRPYPSKGEALPLPAGMRETAEAEAASVRPGNKRKIRGKLAESGLVKKLVF